MKIIGLIGGRGVGKSCVADVVVEVTPNSYCREFYAPARRFLLAAFGNADLVVATRELFGLTFDQIGGAQERDVVDPLWLASPALLYDHVMRLMYLHFGNELERCLAGEVLLNPASLCNDDLVDVVLPDFGVSAADLMRNVVVKLEFLFGPDLLVKRALRELELVTAESLEKGEPLPELVVFSDAERFDFADFVADSGVLVEVIRPGFERTGVSYDRVRGRLYNEADHYGLEWHSRYNVDDWLRSALPFDPAVHDVGECLERAM